MQSTRHDANLGALHASTLPGYVLDVIVLTSDGGLLATLRDASSPEHAIWHAPSADAAVDLLIGGRCGILIADLGTLRTDAAALLSRLHAQFPELVLMATGRRDEEASVASLVGDGRIYRFLHKPISPARGNLFLSAASRRYFELRNAQPMMMSTVRTMARQPHAGKMAGAIAASILAAGVGLIWFFSRDEVTLQTSSESAAQNQQAQNVADWFAAAKIAEASGRVYEPRGNNAVEYYQAVLKYEPSHAQALAGLNGIALALEEQVNTAIQARNPPQAAAALAALRRARPDYARLPQLQSELIGLSRSMHPSPPAKPAVAPNKAPAPAILASEQTIAPMATQGTSIDGEDLDQPAEILPEQTQIAVDSSSSPIGERSLTEEVPTAEHSDALEQLTLAIRLRERNMLLSPAGNNALEYMQSLIAQYPDVEGVRTEQQRLAFTLLENARTSLTGKQLDDAAAFLAAAEQLMPGMSAAQSLRTQVRQAKEERDFWQSIAEAGTLKPTRPVQAEYPREARVRGAEGWVDVEFTIAPNGSTQDLVVRQAEPKDLFDKSALEAIQRARFEPFLKEGRPVRQRALLRVKYELEE